MTDAQILAVEAAHRALCETPNLSDRAGDALDGLARLLQEVNRPDLSWESSSSRECPVCHGPAGSSLHHDVCAECEREESDRAADAAEARMERHPCC